MVETIGFIRFSDEIAAIADSTATLEQLLTEF